jgi:hypothetical protein
LIKVRPEPTVDNQEDANEAQQDQRLAVVEVQLVIVKRTRTLLSVASAFAFGLAVIAWPLSYHLDLSRGLSGAAPKPSDSIPLLSGYRLGFEDGRVWFYNYQAPYRGNLISTFSVKSGYDLPGIYFRHITLQGSAPAYTTLRASLWYPVLLFAVLPSVWAFRHRHLPFHEHDD